MPTIILRQADDEMSLIAPNGSYQLQGDGPRMSPAGRPASYWEATRRPLPSLCLVAPLMMAYEAGVLWHMGATSAPLRTGADAWMRHALASVNCVLWTYWRCRQRTCCNAYGKRNS